MELNLSLDNLTKAQKLFLYLGTRQPVLDDRAVFSDGTSFYRQPSEPSENDHITIRIRTRKDNVNFVYLRYDDKKELMTKFMSNELFDFYEIKLSPRKEILAYYFELHIGSLKVYYNKRGVIRENDPYYSFFIIPNYKTPDWAKGAVLYQIFVDRFYNGDETNDVLTNEYKYIGANSEQVKDWYKYPNSDGIREFYGGDLKGVIDKLDYLEDLGIDGIYLNPIFVSPSNHKYDIQDYDYVDPHFGVIVNDHGELLEGDKEINKYATRYMTRVTDKENLEESNKLFIKFVEEAHKRNIKVILDGVFNHCGSFNKWLDKEGIYSEDRGYGIGAYNSKQSPYRSFFNFYQGEADENAYDGWWGHDTLPKLNFEGSKELYSYILEVGKKWVSPPYNADGWRLDVAADLGYTKEFNHKFWRDFRKAVKGANSNALILAEHYGDPSDWLHRGDQWDSVMNYDAFMEPITWFLTGMDKHSDSFKGDMLGNHHAFFNAMTHYMSRFHSQSLFVSMNELSNHDHSRFLTRTNGKVGRVGTLGSKAAEEDVKLSVMMEAVVMQMTWVGAPTIYYGDEAGLCGFTDPDNRRTYPWGKENQRLIDLHKTLIDIRRKNKVLKDGSIKFLYGEHNLISYGRFDNDSKLLVIVNNSDEHRKVKIPVWEIGINYYKVCEQLIETYGDDFSTSKNYYTVVKGNIMLDMKPKSTRILKEKKYRNEE